MTLFRTVLLTSGLVLALCGGAAQAQPSRQNGSASKPLTTLQMPALPDPVRVALNPATPLVALEEILEYIDMALIMTVNPGFGGQDFIDSQLHKIEAAAERIAKSGRAIDLEVDGGITPETAKRAVNAGANILVAGTSVFSGGAAAYASNIAALRG